VDGAILERVVTRGSVELHLWTGGPESGPVVVLTHGGSMDHRMWEKQVSVLSPRYRVLTYDMRGHGLSVCGPSEFSPRAAAEDLVAILDAVEVEDAVLVGHSLGGTISQVVALEHPQRVRAFAGIGCACITMRPSLAMRVFARFGPAMARRRGPARMREDTAKRAGVTVETQEYARLAAGAMDDEMFEAQASVSFGDYANVPGYHIGVPLLLLRGAKDGYGFLLSSAPKWARRDGGEFVLVPNAAHNAGQDNPEFVNDRLIRFLERGQGLTECANKRINAEKHFTPLHLCAPRKDALYSRLGWHSAGRTTADGKQATVMTNHVEQRHPPDGALRCR